MLPLLFDVPPEKQEPPTVLKKLPDLIWDENQTRKPCQHKEVWNSILVSTDLAIINTVLKLNCITHLYNCHKALAIYPTNESEKKNQLSGHMGSDATNRGATFCPCPTFF